MFVPSHKMIVLNKQNEIKTIEIMVEILHILHIYKYNILSYI